MSDIAIIGSGFSGLSAAAILAQKGHSVTVYEKNAELGGRARQFKAKGYTFDMGPSWYWMPDVFERFFNRFNKKASDYYELKKLDPGFQIIFDEQNTMSIPSDWQSIQGSCSKSLKREWRKVEPFYERGCFQIRLWSK